MPDAHLNNQARRCGARRLEAVHLTTLRDAEPETVLVVNNHTLPVIIPTMPKVHRSRSKLATPLASAEAVAEEEEVAGFTITSTPLGVGTYQHFPGRFCRPVRKPDLLQQLDDYSWWSFVSQVNDELRNQSFWIYACAFALLFYALLLVSLYVRWKGLRYDGDLRLLDTLTLDAGVAFFGAMVVGTGIFLARQSEELHRGLTAAATRWCPVFRQQGYEVEYVRVERPLLFFVTFHETQLVFRRYYGSRPKAAELEEEPRELIDPIEPPPIVMKQQSKIGRSFRASPKSSTDFPEPDDNINASPEPLPVPKKMKKKRTYLKI